VYSVVSVSSAVYRAKNSANGSWKSAPSREDVPALSDTSTAAEPKPEVVRDHEVPFVERVEVVEVRGEQRPLQADRGRARRLERRHDDVDVRERGARRGQHLRHGKAVGQAFLAVVLRPRHPLLLDGRDDDAVTYDGTGCLVSTVDAEDGGHRR
jgi:hypothetical protein